MTEVVRQATVRWLSHPPQGRARISVNSRAFTELAMSAVDEPDPHPLETTPGEMLAAGLTSILATVLAERLRDDGHAADELILDGSCEIQTSAPAVHRLTALTFSLHGRVPGFDQQQLQSAAERSLQELRSDMGLEDRVTLEIQTTLEGSATNGHGD